MTLRPSDRAWIVLGAGVALWDFLAPDQELLSEAADRYMLAHPWLTRAIVIVVGAHLCNLVPDRLDPLHRLFAAKRIRCPRTRCQIMSLLADNLGAL